jgi:hypothetical protein
MNLLADARNETSGIDLIHDTLSYYYLMCMNGHLSLEQL